jgi:hypothetical protein
MTLLLDARQIAEAEVKWFAAYHERDWKSLESAVKELRKVQFGVNISDDSAANFCHAGEMYIAYNKALADGDKKLAEVCLKRASDFMQFHYQDIVERLER